MTESDSIKLAVLFLIAFWIYYLKITRSFSGRFIYFDKRKKDVSLRLSVFGTPGDTSDLSDVIISLKKCLQDLENKNYHSVIFESHLITAEMIESIQRFTQEQGYSFQNVMFCYTSKWQRVVIPLKTALCRFNLKFANPTTTTFTVVLDRSPASGFDNIYIGK